MKVAYAVLALTILHSSVASAQIGKRDASGIRIAVAPAINVMGARFTGTGTHLFQSHSRIDAGPGAGFAALADWGHVGLTADGGITGHRFGYRDAVAATFRFGARVHPGTDIFGFAPFIELGLFGTVVATKMNPADVPAGLVLRNGTGCCATDDREPEYAEEVYGGTSIGLWLERDIGRGFSFWTRLGWDSGKLASQRYENTWYEAPNSRRLIAQRASVGLQYAFWPLQ